MRKTLMAILLLTGFLASSCSTSAPMVTVTPTITLDGTLRPYPSSTTTITPLPTDYLSPTPSPTITLTPTPILYEVHENDDMYSIGWRFNVSPAQIMTANPTVNPRAMGPGTTLLIPISPDPNPTDSPVEDMTPTATPMFSSLHNPDYYPDALGGMWCFILAENDQGKAVENLSGVVSLMSTDEAREEPAIMPLNLLPPGAALPLVAYFYPPLPADFSISAEVDFFLPVMPEDGRYLPVEVSNENVEIDENGYTAKVSGQLSLSMNPLVTSQTKTRYLWLNATAFDENGHIVATRRWASPEQLAKGKQVNFEIFLYSLGAPIDRVELLAEAQPPLQLPTEQ